MTRWDQGKPSTTKEIDKTMTFLSKIIKFSARQSLECEWCEALLPVENLQASRRLDSDGLPQICQKRSHF